MTSHSAPVAPWWHFLTDMHLPLCFLQREVAFSSQAEGSCNRTVQVGATAVRRMTSNTVHAFHRKHRGSRCVDPEVQQSWSEVSCMLNIGFLGAPTADGSQMESHPVAT